MKLKFGRGARRLFEVSRETDYFLDNGACIQLITTDNEKKKIQKWNVIKNFIFPKTRFQRLLEGGYIQLRKRELYSKICGCGDDLLYYTFTNKIKEFKEEFI